MNGLSVVRPIETIKTSFYTEISSVACCVVSYGGKYTVGLQCRGKIVSGHPSSCALRGATHQKQTEQPQTDTADKRHNQIIINNNKQ